MIRSGLEGEKLSKISNTGGILNFSESFSEKILQPSTVMDHVTIILY